MYLNEVSLENLQPQVRQNRIVDNSGNTTLCACHLFCKEQNGNHLTAKIVIQLRAVLIFIYVSFNELVSIRTLVK